MNKIYTNVAQQRDDILLRGYDENGTRVQERIEYSPYLFVRNNGKSKDEGYRSLVGGEELSKMSFETMTAARDFVKQYKGVGSMEIHGLDKWIYPFINDNYPGLQLQVDLDIIKICYMDIEVRSNDGFPKPETALSELTAITVSDGTTYDVFAIRDFMNDRPDVRYHQFDNERELMYGFIDFFRKQDYDVVTGWNVEGFDMPYLYNRISNVLSKREADSMSPWNRVYARSYFDRNGMEQNTVELIGIATLDFYQLYLKFSTSAKQEQYKLGYIAQVELGEAKVNYSEYRNLEELYQQNHQLYIEYNIKDVELVVRLEKKLKFLQQAMAISYDAKINFSDATTSVLLWDVIIHNNLMERKIIVPPATHSEKDGQVRGAYVKDPGVGKYDWLVSFDLASLYPHLIMQYNISPETFRGMAGITSEDILAKNDVWKEVHQYCIDHNYTLCGNGAMFTRDFRGILPELMEAYYEDRKKFKNMQLDAERRSEENPNDKSIKSEIVLYKNIQMAKKIALNSAYGALLNQYFRYFDVKLGEGVTMSGQTGILWIASNINDMMNTLLKTDTDYIIASDTDSVVGDTIIQINGIDMTIEDYYNSIPDGFIKKDDFNEQYVKRITSPTTTPSYSEEQKIVVHNQVNYVMKHKVKKKMYKITVGDRSVTLTEDHSLSVLRDGVLISCKPTDLHPEDQIIINAFDTDSYMNKENYHTVNVSDAKIECLGVQEIEVYDIEVDDTHNFFANDILVHNSVYVSMDALVHARYKGALPDYKPTIVDFLDKICESKFQPFIEEKYQELCGMVNGYDQRMKMKREAIAERAIWTGGKHYIMNVWNNEGVAYKNKVTGEFEPHFKMVGIEAVKSTTPTVCRGAIKEAAMIIISGDQKKLIKYVDDFREIFKTANPADIARNSSVKVDKYEFGALRVPMHTNAALLYNKLLSERGLGDIYPRIKTGERIKYINLKMPNPVQHKCIAFIGDELPVEFDVIPYIDHEYQLQVGFLNAVKTIADAAGMTVEEVSTLDSFFC